MTPDYSAFLAFLLIALFVSWVAEMNCEVRE